MTVVLGITDGDDGGAALVVDGELVAAVNEERMNRLKMSIGFPKTSVKEVLRLGNVNPEQIKTVAVAALRESVTEEAKPNKGWFHDDTAFTTAAVRNRIGSALSRPLGKFRFARRCWGALKNLTSGPRRRNVTERLRELGIDAEVSYQEHHRCHNFSAIAASGFERGLTISLDGGGDDVCSETYRFDSSSSELLNRVDSFHSIGNYYAYVTHLCGYRAGIHEGKITGLAASGDPGKYRHIFKKLVRYRDGQIENCGRLYFRSAIRRIRAELPQSWDKGNLDDKADLAASIQAHLEDVVTDFVQYWAQKSGESSLALSGGVFANVRLNQHIAELPEVERVFVFPAMGDGGLASGAVYSHLAREKGPIAAPHTSGLKTAYLGTGYADEEIKSAITAADLQAEHCDNIERKIAELLSEGYVVARFDDRMEYGPRALGNRSILYHPTDKSVNDWLNTCLKRTEFMPFAPATIYEEAENCYVSLNGSANAARFMTITVDCTEEMKRSCPGVVHIDGTVRPQLVRNEDNPSFYKVLTEFKAITGLPCVINTSFNMHEEPIVRSPDDAIRAFTMGHLDFLAIGDYLLRKSGAFVHEARPCKTITQNEKVARS